MKQNPFALIVGTALLLVFGVLLFVFQVRQSQVAVITTFGKPTRDILQPGAWVTIATNLPSTAPQNVYTSPVPVNVQLYRIKVRIAP